MRKRPDDCLDCDVLILGCGAAGLALALRLPREARVLILSKGRLEMSSSFYAQGGIAAAIDEDDSFESHLNDTLAAGYGLCNERVARRVIEQGEEIIDWLQQQQTHFSTYGGKRLHLGREGGHSRRRIVHADDATGREIARALSMRVKACEHIMLLEQHTAVDLIVDEGRCQGAYVLDNRSGEVKTIGASFVALATGGASRVYLYSTNPECASGDGIAIAWRAGCRVANLEFNQFHPTCLYHGESQPFLISEALRGEGAKLRLPDGSSFMHRFHEQAEMAPRDIVARAIDSEMKRSGAEFVLLDISHRPQALIQEHFPTIFAHCLKLGLDISKEPIPVVPAAHYTCGGILVDDQGRTDLKGLYAIGETSCTGLHGANRMASNSLLECMSYARAAALDIAALLPDQAPTRALPAWENAQKNSSDEGVVITHDWDELRRVMWNYVGIARSDKRLKRAQSRIALLKAEVNEFYSSYPLSRDLLELRNLLIVAELMVRCAMERKESRGLHHTLDYPKMLDEARNTVLTPRKATTS